MKRNGWIGAGLFLTILFFGGRIVAEASAQAPPKVCSLSHVSWPFLPRDVEGLAVDEGNTLWCLDRSGARILVLSAEGNLLHTIGSPGVNEGELQDPLTLSLELNSRRVAVADTASSLVFFDMDSGHYLYTLYGLHTYNIFAFFLTPQRIVFTNWGIPREKSPEPPFFAMPLFSVNPKGEDLQVARGCEKLLVTAQDHGSFCLFQRGFSALFRQGLWVVCKSLPMQLLLVDGQGNVVKKGAPIGRISPLPVSRFLESGFQLKALHDIPHATGVVVWRGRIGVLWQEPPVPGPQLRLRWFDDTLKPIGETSLDLGKTLVPQDVVMASLCDSEGRLYVLVVHRGGLPPGQSTLYLGRLP